MRFFVICLLALAGTHTTAQDAQRWKKLQDTGWLNAAKPGQDGLTVEVLDEPAVLRLRAVTSLDKKSAELSVEWPGAELLKDFIRFEGDDGTRSKSTSRLGTATLTRTVLLDAENGVVFIHLHADQPGALDFRVKSNTPANIIDRRQLVTRAPTDVASHLWVWPFESDVSPDAGAIRVRGEGEALIVWAYGKRESAETRAETWSRLAKRYDPGQDHPNPSLIWRGVLADHLKRHPDPR